MKTQRLNNEVREAIKYEVLSSARKTVTEIEKILSNTLSGLMRFGLSDSMLAAYDDKIRETNELKFVSIYDLLVLSGVDMESDPFKRWQSNNFYKGIFLAGVPDCYQSINKDAKSVFDTIKVDEDVLYSIVASVIAYLETYDKYLSLKTELDEILPSIKTVDELEEKCEVGYLAYLHINK